MAYPTLHALVIPESVDRCVRGACPQCNGAATAGLMIPCCVLRGELGPTEEFPPSQCTAVTCGGHPRAQHAHVQCVCPAHFPGFLCAAALPYLHPNRKEGKGQN